MHILYQKLCLVNVPDMFRISIWKLYFKLMNNTLPLYFNDMKPEIPRVCDIGHSTFHLPNLSHEFAEQQIQYQMVKILNNKKCSIYSQEKSTLINYVV